MFNGEGEGGILVCRAGFFPHLQFVSSAGSPNQLSGSERRRAVPGGATWVIMAFFWFQGVWMKGTVAKHRRREPCRSFMDFGLTPVVIVTQ